MSKSDRARSRSINPKIYPEWWGEEPEAESPAKHTQHFKVPKRLRSADPCKAKINKAIKRHCEDSLDKRLRMVYEHKEEDDHHHHIVHHGNHDHDVIHEHGRNGNASYAYTKQQNVSPIRQPMAG